jgi:hypothetical protein
MIPAVTVSRTTSAAISAAIAQANAPIRAAFALIVEQRQATLEAAQAAIAASVATRALPLTRTGRV